MNETVMMCRRLFMRRQHGLLSTPKDTGGVNNRLLSTERVSSSMSMAATEQQRQASMRTPPNNQVAPSPSAEEQLCPNAPLAFDTHKLVR